MIDLDQLAEVLGHSIADGRTVTVGLRGGKNLTGSVSDHPTDPDLYVIDGVAFAAWEVEEVTNE